MVDIDIGYEGSLRCQATHGPSGDQLKTDAPVDNHGRGEAFSPTDLVAGALGTCMLTILGIMADRDGIDVTGAKASVQKEMSTDTPRRISRLVVVIDIPLPADHPDREKLERGAMACPVKQSLHPEIDLPVRFQWSG